METADLRNIDLKPEHSVAFASITMAPSIVDYGIIQSMNENQTTETEDKPKVHKDLEAEAKALSVRPTKKQKELLDYIDTFITEHGYSPSYREIMNGLQYTSVATVALHVGNLIKRGHLRKRDHSARSLEVVRHAGQPAVVPLKTNGVKVGEEKWLVAKVEQLFKDAEAELSLQQQHLDNLYVLFGALRVLGLESAAQSFAARLKALTVKLEQNTTAG
jgi:repressor LexA